MVLVNIAVVALMPTQSSVLSHVAHLLGVERRASSHAERWLSMAGGLLGIALVSAVAVLHPLGAGSALVMASMGASAVLVFAVPHGALSQPWAVLGGHLSSAFVGVTVAQFIDAPLLAGPVAVGFAILAMHYARCLHPPGGATALAAVIGGSEIQALGYGYLLAPVLLNVLLLLGAGMIFNAPFRWRRYPVALAPPPAPSEPAGAQLEHADLVYALSEIDSFIDVSEGDLLRIYDLAMRHADADHLAPEMIRPGCCYSNGRFGPDWAVRCIVDASDDPTSEQLIYRGVAGAERRTSGTLSRAAFARWARYEVVRDETTWRPVQVAGERDDGGGRAE